MLPKFIPNFDVLYDLLLYRLTTTRNLFVFNYVTEQNDVAGKVNYAFVNHKEEPIKMRVPLNLSCD